MAVHNGVHADEEVPRSLDEIPSEGLPEFKDVKSLAGVVMGAAPLGDFRKAFLKEASDLPCDVLFDLSLLEPRSEVLKSAVTSPEGAEVSGAGNAHEPCGLEDGAVGDLLEGFLGRLFERPKGFWKSDVFHVPILGGEMMVRPIGDVVVSSSRRALASSAGAFRDPGGAARQPGRGVWRRERVAMFREEG